MGVKRPAAGGNRRRDGNGHPFHKSRRETIALRKTTTTVARKRRAVKRTVQAAGRTGGMCPVPKP